MGSFGFYFIGVIFEISLCFFFSFFTTIYFTLHCTALQWGGEGGGGLSGVALFASGQKLPGHLYLYLYLHWISISTSTSTSTNTGIVIGMVTDIFFCIAFGIVFGIATGIGIVSGIVIGIDLGYS